MLVTLIVVAFANISANAQGTSGTMQSSSSRRSEWRNVQSGRVPSSNNRGRKTPSVQASPVSSLFGSPNDYDDRYQAYLDGGLGVASAARRNEGNSLTPAEELLAPEYMGGRDSPSTGIRNEGGAAIKRVVGERQRSDNSGSTVIRPGSTLTVSPYSSSVFGKTDAGVSVYRSPW